jgi:hypothetical protein
MPRDQAERIAATIMVMAFSSPHAREQIANLLQLAFMEGELAGINHAREIVNSVPTKGGGKQ